MTITHIQDPAGPTRRPGVAPARPLGKALFAAVLGLAMACTATVGDAAAHSAAPATPAAVNSSKIYFGVDGTVSQAAQGQNVARHIYGQLTASVPNARMVTMGIDGLTYADVAAAAPGSATYANIVRWADTIKARGTQTFFGFAHEPESNDQAHSGTATQYISAYRHVVDVMRAQNVPNVSYVWQLTAYGFVRKDSRNVINYYPGDTYVDYVAADAYNWGGCESALLVARPQRRRKTGAGLRRSPQQTGHARRVRVAERPAAGGVAGLGSAVLRRQPQ